jgi:solute carrier family 25 (mitochondrial S-adenosylmethionine transporter), member 26
MLTRTAGAFFTTYEGVKSIFKKANPTLGRSSRPLVPQPFIDSGASAIAELVSCFILTPAEVLKQNAQMIRRPEHSVSKSSTTFQPSVTMEALRHFRKPTQLWRGYTALAARNLPFTAMQFPMFEHLKKTIKDYRQQTGTAKGSLIETAIITAISAGSAGSVAAVITTPVDVVKTRIMLSAAGYSSDADAMKEVERARAKGQSAVSLATERGVTRKSGLTVAQEVIRESGLKGLFRGGILRGTWTALGSGLYLGVYETGRHFLGDRRKTADP